jgi:hypothetical protein
MPLSGRHRDAQQSSNTLIPGGVTCVVDDEVSDTEQLDAVILCAKRENFTMATPLKIRL